MSIAKEPYGFHPLFERAIVYMCASSQQFWARAGHLIDPDCVGTVPARLIIEGCRLIQHSSGKGPSSMVMLLQRLRRLVAEGKLKLEYVLEVADLLDAAEDYGLPPEEDMVMELAPILKRRLHAAALEQGAASFATRGDLSKTRTLLDQAEKVGVLEGSNISHRLDIDGFEPIEEMGNVMRLSTGILELDLQLNSGMPIRSLGVFLGGAGDGKSQALISQAAEGVRRGKHTGVITLELPKSVQNARLYANLTGIETDMILDNAQARHEAKRRIQIMTPSIGVCSVVDMPPHATSVRDVVEWVDEREQAVGRKMELLIVDYADKMSDPKMKDQNEYVAMRNVYEGLRRDVAAARDMWVWTASQGSRPNKDQGKRLDLKDVADSMHKVRVADWVVSLNVRDEGREMLFYVAKNRHGRSRFEVGPIPTDFARGRVVPHASEWAQW